MQTEVLLLTNGHGEDELGALLAREVMRAAPAVRVWAFPLVGEGGAYRRAELPVIGVQKVMPSGGFILKAARNFAADVRAGLLGLVRRQWAYLRGERGRFHWTIALGDVYPLVLAAFAVRRPLVFVPTAKSEYIAGHYGWEIRLMRRCARKVYPRDEKTAAALRSAGVNAEFVGNLMMDAVGDEPLPCDLPAGRKVVAFLPGSRADAYVNLVDLLQVAAELPSHVALLLSLAPSLDVAEVARVAAAQGWQVSELRNGEGARCGLRLASGEREIAAVQGRFGGILRRADVVVGLAGTGNEQAAGLGRPVVAFPGRGMQFTRRFAEAQKRLLGEAVSLVAREPKVVAQEVARLLEDPELYRRKAREGMRRMGPPGAGRRMAQDILAVMSGVPPATRSYTRGT